MTNTATKPLSLPDASLLQFPSSSLVTSPHDCSHCPPSWLLSFSSSPRQALSWSVQDTEQDILAANPKKIYTQMAGVSKSPYKSCCLLVGARTVDLSKYSDNHKIKGTSVNQSSLDALLGSHMNTGKIRLWDLQITCQHLWLLDNKGPKQREEWKSTCKKQHVCVNT